MTDSALPARVARFTAPAWWPEMLTRSRLLAGGTLALLYSGGLAYGSWTRVCAAERCPSISRLKNHGPPQTAKVYAADGRLITELGLERRTVLRLNQIPLPVQQAFIATEDKRFYQHHGIDYWRIFGALKANVMTLGYSQGFSTTTMQLARNVFPTSSAATRNSRASSKKRAWRSKSRTIFPRTRFSSSISIRSTSARGRTAWKPRRRSISASRRAN